MKAPRIYYINLDHRTDRRAEFDNEMTTLRHAIVDDDPDAPIPEVIRIPAIKNAVGAIGCGMSHCLALQKFLDSEDETAIIMEDDFTFHPKMIPLLVEYLAEGKIPCEADILLLSANLRDYRPDKREFIRVLRSFTTSGYWITRALAQDLIRLWDCCNLLHGVSVNKPNPYYCIDVAWWGLMTDRRFLALTPAIGQIGYQRPGFSDIEQRSVSYGV